eukprot:1593257-Rhodomonas_salina.2
MTSQPTMLQSAPVRCTSTPTALFRVTLHSDSATFPPFCARVASRVSPGQCSANAEHSGGQRHLADDAVHAVVLDRALLEPHVAAIHGEHAALAARVQHAALHDRGPRVGNHQPDPLLAPHRAL